MTQPKVVLGSVGPNVKAVLKTDIGKALEAKLLVGLPGKGGVVQYQVNGSNVGTPAAIRTLNFTGDGISGSASGDTATVYAAYSGVFRPDPWDMSSGTSGPAAPAIDYQAAHTSTTITPAGTLSGAGPLYWSAVESRTIALTGSGTGSASMIVPAHGGGDTVLVAVLALVNTGATQQDIEDIINGQSPTNATWLSALDVNLAGPAFALGHNNNGTSGTDASGSCSVGQTVYYDFDLSNGHASVTIGGTLYGPSVLDIGSIPAGQGLKLVAGLISTSASVVFGAGHLTVNFAETAGGRTAFSITHDADLPVGALDNDWYRVSVGGYFHGTTTTEGQTVKLISGKTDLIVVPKVQDGPVQSVNGQTGVVVLSPGDVAAVSYNSQSLSDAQKIQAQRNLGTQLFFGQDFPTGAVAPAALMKFDSTGMWIDFVVRQVTPIWHGYVSSLMLMASTADKVTANTWADPFGYIHDGALRPDGTPQQGITCTPGNLASFDLSSGDFTIEFFYTPSAYDNIYPENRGMLSFGGGHPGDTLYFLRYVGGAGFVFYVYPSPGSPQIAAKSASVLTTGAEHHIAIQRKSGVYSITVNGADVTYEQHNVAPSAPVSGNQLSLGQLYMGGYSEQMTGSIRQFRMVKGVAVYPTYPFTPPTSFPSSI